MDIRTLRLNLGLSQQELAARLGVHERTVLRWERGQSRPPRAALEWLRDRLSTGRRLVGDAFTFIDLFAGIGGIRRGFEAVGGRCVFTSEWDKYAQRTYRANFGAQHPIAGDIRQVPAELIPRHDVLLAGFPCQPFSIAGVSKKNSLGRAHGFACETQGTLFFDVARILAYHEPTAFLLENVKNLKTHDGGRTFDVIMRTLSDELGYTVTTRIIDAKSFVPQHRERILIVGFRQDRGFSLDEVAVPDARCGPRLSTVLHPQDGSEEPEPRFLDHGGKVLPRYTLTDKLWSYLQAYADKHRARGNGFGYGIFGPEDVARTLSARYHKDGSEILIRQDKGQNPRRLTPRECARLMGFDGPHERLQIPVSDTQAYRQFGNSVVVPVIGSVARAMAPYITMRTLGERTQLDLPFARSA